MSETVGLITGFLIGYVIGVIKEKAKWIEKYISARRAKEYVEESD